MNFENTELGLNIRVFADGEGNPLFVANELAEGLGYKHAPHLVRLLDDDEKGVLKVDTLGGKQEMTVITESGFYHAAMKSRVPQAKTFRKWVTGEVLPQIRQTGGYIPVEKFDDEKMILGKALNILLKTVDKQKASLAEQSQEIERLTPLAEYADSVLLSPTCYTMTQVAKTLSMTVNELQHRLHKLHIIYRSPSGPWMLYADYLKMGLEAYRTSKGDNLKGDVLWTDSYLVWTEKGRKFITQCFKEVA